MLILTAIFAISGVASAQTGSISGVVKTKDTGAPLAGANVVIVGTSIGGASEANGRYAIANVPAGIAPLRPGAARAFFNSSTAGRSAASTASI